MANDKVLIYLFRNDLRVGDHPVLHHLASVEHDYTHFLPVYVFPASQMNLSGFIKDDAQRQLYPVPTSRVGRFPRCGPHRVKFLAESVWDLKTSLRSLDSDLLLRVGDHNEVVEDLVDAFKPRDIEVGAVWMTGHLGSEEQAQEDAVSAVCKERSVEFKVWVDEKYFVDDRDLNFDSPDKLPEVFTTYAKSLGPLREQPRCVLPRPPKSSLPPFPDVINISPQFKPFTMPEEYGELEEALKKPTRVALLKNVPPFPSTAINGHPFKGGEVAGLDRLKEIILNKSATDYKTTRNGLLGVNFSTKLSAYLAQGSLTAREIHAALRELEDGTNEEFRDAEGFGKGECPGTLAIREELLWRDYMRLYHRKVQDNMFHLEGVREYKNPEKKPQWKTADGRTAAADQEPSVAVIHGKLQRFLEGTTGLGLIDASQRELFHTGYTSNRARQNVANFLAKALNIDWRYGAEWYEMLLVDYDVSSNWGNWQYVSGVGPDPRSESRFFNPVKQAFDYDDGGRYVRAWIPEAANLPDLLNVFQLCTLSEEEAQAAGIQDSVMYNDPILRIDYSIERKPRNNKRSFNNKKERHGRRNDGEEDAGEHSKTLGKQSHAGSRAGGGGRVSPRDGNTERNIGKSSWRNPTPPSDSDGSRPSSGSPLVVSSPSSHGPHSPHSSTHSHHRDYSSSSNNTSWGSRKGYPSTNNRGPVGGDYVGGYPTGDRTSTYRPPQSSGSRLEYRPVPSGNRPATDYRPQDYRGPTTRPQQASGQSGYASRN